MKSVALLFFMAVIIMVGVSDAFCGLKDSALDRNVKITEEAALLSQVDTVSQYLTSNEIAFAPRFTGNNVVEVETTVLDRSIVRGNNELQSYVMRRIRTFISVLEERLPLYAPNLAKTFDPKTDIAFIINKGSTRRFVASWSGGTWRWESGRSNLAPYVSQLPTYGASYNYATSVSKDKVKVKKKPQGQGKLGCNCPARRD